MVVLYFTGAYRATVADHDCQYATQSLFSLRYVSASRLLDLARRLTVIVRLMASERAYRESTTVSYSEKLAKELKTLL